MVSMHESENFGLICGRKVTTFRKANYSNFKILGNYLAKNGMFDDFPIAHILITDLKQTKAVINDDDANRLGFDNKEEYFKHNFNNFNKNDNTKQLTKCDFINLDLLYGCINELDNWIDREIEKKWKINLGD